ncbi:hypothetical protein Patl1_24944 [Pistacia atlantica]|uniref:Uncharacterized protein n=1 Tax=Pistacia atlantica TaxID=434234 RepID=A0ACC1B086_9ROSI|nr:hypothetical protein Patl1_24944 [Pistacia atlantica]
MAFLLLLAVYYFWKKWLRKRPAVRTLRLAPPATLQFNPDTTGASNSNFGKAVARRAVSGSRKRRVHGRKVATGDARSLPSRLSKVSLAEDSSD